MQYAILMELFCLPQVLPDIMSIISKWQSLAKNEKKENVQQLDLENLKAEEVKTEGHCKTWVLLFYLMCFIVLILIK